MILSYEKIQELRRQWGDKPCQHPLLKKAAVTNDKVCTTCGSVVYSGKRYEIKKDIFGNELDGIYPI